MPVDAKAAQRVVLTYVEGEDTPIASSVATYVSHFASCPNALQHRRAGG